MVKKNPKLLKIHLIHKENLFIQLWRFIQSIVEIYLFNYGQENPKYLKHT